MFNIVDARGLFSSQSLDRQQKHEEQTSHAWWSLQSLTQQLDERNPVAVDQSIDN